MRAGYLLSLLFCLLTLSLQAQTDPPPTLTIGDPAPALRVQEWIKGEPVQRFEKGHVYVVEFWAVACPPCRSAIPHLTALAEKYKGSATVIGVDLLSTEFIQKEKVKAFVDKMGDRMNYVVAVEDSNFVSTDWLEAADEKRQGIPRIYIIDKEGKIAWMGNPVDVDKVLHKIVNDRWDIKKSFAKRNFDRYLDSLDSEAAYRLIPYFNNGNNDLASLAIHSMILQEPKLKYAPRVAYRSFVLLLKTDQDKAHKYARKAMRSPTYEEPAFSTIIDVVTWYGDSLNLSPAIYRLGAKASRTYINGIPYPENLEMHKLYTRLAEFYSRGNRRSKAIRAQKKAIDVLKSKKDYPTEDLAALESQLKQYRGM